MGKLLLGAVVGGIILMVWGFVFWAAGLYSVQELPNGDVVAQALKSNSTQTGTYFYPYGTEMEAPGGGEPEWVTKHKEGPFFMISYTAEGCDPTDASGMLIGLLHNIVSAFLAILLLSMALPSTNTYGKRVWFITLIGLFIAFFADLSAPIWFHTPWDLPTANFIYHLAGWLFAGLGIAAIVKPKTKA